MCKNNTDFREIQCSSFNEKLFNGQKYTWSAYYHGEYSKIYKFSVQNVLLLFTIQYKS